MKWNIRFFEYFFSKKCESYVDFMLSPFFVSGVFTKNFLDILYISRHFELLERTKVQKFMLNM